MSPSSPAVGDVAQYVGALTITVETGNHRSNVEFLGTAFSLAQPYRLFMTAAHLLPEEIPPPGRLAVTLRRGETVHSFWVQDHEILGGRTDVAVLRVEEGVEHLFGLAPREASMLEDIYAVGIPDSLVERRRPGLSLRMRGLRGMVTRKLEVGDVVAGKPITAPTYEIDPAIPEGMSGAPAFASSMGRNTDLVGLVGVCLGSYFSESTLWSEESSAGETNRGVRVNQFGLVARLFPSYGTVIKLVDAPLNVLVAPAVGPRGPGAD
jgi:trypsin-like peptidase